MGKHLVFVGGGHAHMTALSKLDDYRKKGHRVTLISSHEYHYYSGMGPGVLSGMYAPEEICFHVRKLAEDRGAVFIEQKVVQIEASTKQLLLENGGQVDYDVVSFNVGSDVPMGPVREVEKNMFPVKPIINLVRARDWVLNLIQTKEPNILVIGGGPAGLETVGSVWRFVHDNSGKAQITLIAGTKLLSQYPEKVRRLAISSLRARGVEVIEGQHVERCGGGEAVLKDNRVLSYDMVLLAIGVKPPSLFRDSGIPIGVDGGLLVNKYLQSVEYPDMCGGGDCISFQDRNLDKVGVYAVRENPVLYRNLMAALEDKQLSAFDPGGKYLLIFNLGDGKGIFWKHKLVFNGRFSFMLKDYIDRKFMRKFQLSGELTRGGR